jgi:NAD(P)-dependent dehydrogenase (short-subunit alcohol dehydrogenase family)
VFDLAPTIHVVVTSAQRHFEGEIMADELTAEARLARFGADRLPFDQIDKRVRDLVDLTGVRALVTGGGGRNLGQAIVHRLAGAGARVVVADLDAESSTRVASDAADRWDTETFAVCGDTTDWDGAHAVVAEACSMLGGIDLLVNNVGGGAGAFSTMDRAGIEKVVGTTLLSTLYVSRATLDVMLPAGSGCIVNISSEGSRMASAHISLYNSLKSGVNGFTRNLAAEVGRQGIRVVGVAPGMMLGEALIDTLKHPEGFESRIASMEQTLPRISVGRCCLPEEVANLVVFLASEAGAHVHGTTISVGGGMSS